MPWQMPSPPPGLVELLKRGGQVPPTGAPGQTAAQPAPMDPSGQDVIRAAVAPAPVQPAQTPPPASDDPAVNPISKLPPVPTPPDMSNSPVVGLQKQMADTSSQISNVPRPDPAKLKPKLWERIAGGLTAGAVAYKSGPEAGIDIGSNVTDRRWNGAQSQYKRTISPLQQQLETERQQLPAAEAAAKIPQNAWENSMKQRTEQRETATAQSNAGYKSDLNDIRTMLDNNKHEEALKKIADTEAKNKNDLDVKNQLLDLKNQALELKRQQIESGTGKKGQLTDAQKAGIENRKGQSLQKAEDNYRRTVGQLSPTDEPGKKDALDQLNQDKQAAQDNYENEISSAGGSPSHMDVNAPKAAPQGSPAATPQTGGITVSKANLQKAATAHFGGDYGKAKAQFLKDNPTGKVQE